MKQSSEYLLNNALKKEANPKNWKIVQVPTPKNAPRQWQFPDGSKMTETSCNSTILVDLEEII